MISPRCIVCGKPIKKKMASLSFYPATLNGRENGTRSDSGRAIYLDDEFRPRNKAEAQKYTNYEIRSVSYGSGERIFSISWWEGEYEDEFFHSQQCAARQGYAAARAGHRWTWKN